MDAVPQCHLQYLQGSVQGLRKLRIEGIGFEYPQAISLGPFEVSCKAFKRQGGFEAGVHHNQFLPCFNACPSVHAGLYTEWIPRYRLCLGTRPG